MMATPANHTRDPTQPVCQNCSTSTTPLWRRDEYGAVLCNACGLFLKLHGRPRPISLKTDVIKSRNRVKTMRPDLATKKKVCARFASRLQPPR
jgi:GATA-binding protein, other eukaryote